MQVNDKSSEMTETHLCVFVCYTISHCFFMLTCSARILAPLSFGSVIQMDVSLFPVISDGL